jgi:CheY-like chemotaxis protein
MDLHELLQDLYRERQTLIRMIDSLEELRESESLPASRLSGSSPMRDIVSIQRRIILVVDDEVSGAILEEAGYAVLKASNELEALAVSRRYDGHIHLLLTDVEMPGMSGIELARQMVAERPGMTVLLTSGNPDHTEQSEFSFLPKPFSLEKLRDAVARVLEAGVADDLASTAKERKPRKFWLPGGAPIWAAAAAAIVLAVIPFGALLRNRQLSEPQVVDLRAVRGQNGEAKVPSGKPLLLNLDISGLPRSASYRIEMVDKSGQTIWQKMAAPAGAAGSEIRTNSAAPRPGRYFVRVYAPPDELLMEYVLRVDGSQQANDRRK